PGFLNFISPLVSSVPVSSILMGDMAILREGKDCGCGIDTPYFEVLGRAGRIQTRSCAIAASEYIKGGEYE
ncbi:MAG: acyl-protein synthetase, partial [Epulopiscium sp.]|nr:acyl-protein synthetase [Candidatus Epulonipiscium sp.]